MLWQNLLLEDAQLARIIQNEVGSQMLLSRKLPDSEVTSTNDLSIRWATGYEWVLSPEKDIDWDLEFKSQVASNKLWLYSLGAVGRLSLDALPGSHKHFWAEKIVRSFIARSTDADFIHRLMSIPSSDHSTATRVSALVQYLKVLRNAPEKDWDHIRNVVALIRFWCDWLTGEGRFSKNNHGVMVSMALLSGAAQLQDLDEASEYSRIAEHRIRTIVDMSFDRDGMCFENTVGYHNFNLSLYRRVISFLVVHQPQSEILSFLQMFMAKAEGALAIAIRPNQTIPPLGDSPVYRIDLPSVNKSRSFTESGLTIIKKDDFYLSFVCGARSEAHKQQDDTSFTIFYRGKDIVTDGGSYNYDPKDRFRQSIQSSFGHSGVFPLFTEGLSRRKLLRASKGKFYSETTNFVDTDDFTAVQGVAGLRDSTVHAVRTILVAWPNEVVVVDTVDHADSLTDRGWVNRTLFGSGLEVEEAGLQQFDFSTGDVLGSLLIPPGGHRDFYRALDGEVVKGWCSVKNGEIRPTHGLDVRTESRAARFVTAIRLDKHATSIDEFSPLSRKFSVGLWSPFPGNIS